MPEMTPLPNLLPAPSSTTNSIRAANGAAAPSNGTSNAGAADASNTSIAAKSPAAGKADDASTSPESFAMVLQRQLTQSAQSVNADQPQPAIALLPDLTLLQQPVNALLTDAALLQQPASTLLPDLKQRPASAQPPSLEQQTVQQTLQQPLQQPVSALLPVLALQQTLVSTPEAELPSTPKDLASQDIADDTPASQSPYLFAATPQIPAKLDADLAETEKKPAGDRLLNASPPALILSQTPGSKNDAQASTAKVPPETASKTAEFAAILASSAEAVPAQASRGEPAAVSGTSFENMLGVAQMTSLHRNGEAHATSPASSALPIQTPVGAHGWDGEVGDKLVWMVGRQDQRAELILNPPQLGRVEVSLSMNGDQTNAIFVSANPAVRDALEAALPRLREILADAGINLGQAQVGADTGNNGANQSTNNGKNSDNQGRGSSMDDLALGGETQGPVGVPQWLKRVNGMVDVFA